MNPKPEKAWAVYNPNGWLIFMRTDYNKPNLKYAFVTNWYYFTDSWKAQWKRCRAQGYRCLRVKITPKKKG